MQKSGWERGKEKVQSMRIYKSLKSIENICFFEVNTKYISASELKILMFSTHKMKYIWYSPKKANFLFILYFLDQFLDKT